MANGVRTSYQIKEVATISFRGDRRKGKGEEERGTGHYRFRHGDPDLPTPSPIIEEIKKQLDDPENHRYPSSSGELDARKAVADWYERRFGVNLDPNGQVAILIGSKEGLANICRAFVNPGEKVLCPDIAYPVYAQGAATLSDAVPVRFPLRAENKFLPQT